MQLKKCLFCGKEFEDKTDNKNKLYCSSRCGKKYRRKLLYPIIEKECPNCNKKFLSSNNNKIFCSNYCNLDNWKKYIRTDEMRNRSKEYAVSQKGKYLNIQGGARSRNYSFNLSINEYIENFWNKQCYYCGGKTQNGIDRVDNSIGYELSNCVPCCLKCNKMKNNLLTSDFFSHIKQIYKHSKLNKYCPGVIPGPIKE